MISAPLSVRVSPVFQRVDAGSEARIECDVRGGGSSEGEEMLTASRISVVWWKDGRALNALDKNSVGHNSKVGLCGNIFFAQNKLAPQESNFPHH